MKGGENGILTRKGGGEDGLRTGGEGGGGEEELEYQGHEWIERRGSPSVEVFGAHVMVITVRSVASPLHVGCDQPSNGRVTVVSWSRGPSRVESESGSRARSRAVHSRYVHGYDSSHHVGHWGRLLSFINNK